MTSFSVDLNHRPPQFPCPPQNTRTRERDFARAYYTRDIQRCIGEEKMKKQRRFVSDLPPHSEKPTGLSLSLSLLLAPR
jgi:hypothetical protein